MSSSYVLTLPLQTELWQEHILNKRLEIARQIYNACLGEALRRYQYLSRNQEYWEMVHSEKSKQRTQSLKQYRQDYGVTEYSLHDYVKPMYKKFKIHIGSAMAQKIATRAFRTVEKIIYGNGKQAHFSPKGQFYSVEEKSNKTGLRFDDNQITWLGLEIPVILKANDEYAHLALQNRVKYCRLFKKVIRGKERFLVQLVLDGIPAKKLNQPSRADKDARVGLDIGTSTIGISSDKAVQLLELAPDIQIDEKQRRVLQRKLDRQRRANNPNKYNPDGTIKRNNRERWKNSKNYIKTRKQLAELNRKIADKRKQSHNQLANHILTLGLDVRVETMRFQALQKRAKETTVNKKTGKINRKKRYGKSIARRAPALLIRIIDQKLKYQGLSIKKIDTAKVRASQFNHFDQSYTKKHLGKRWNHFEQGDYQRDLYSAFLIMNTDDHLKEVDVECAKQTWQQFARLHDKEMERIRKLGTKQLSSFGI